MTLLLAASLLGAVGGAAAYRAFAGRTSGQGRLVVHSDRPAAVFAAGANRGSTQTGALSFEVPLGPCLVLFSEPDGGTRRLTVQIRPGADTFVDARLDELVTVD